MEEEVRVLYERIMGAWNRREAGAFAAQFLDDGHTIGFDGSQADSAAEIAEHLGQVFGSHQTATYVWEVRHVQPLPSAPGGLAANVSTRSDREGPDAALLLSVVGMVPPGGDDLNPAVNAVQSLVAVRQSDGWRAALLQTTPAAYHGRPEASAALTEELRALLARQR